MLKHLLIFKVVNMKKQFIEIKTDFEATHNWPECPFDDVKFLKNEHRHKIYIKVKLKTDEDRQLEFFKFKYQIDEIIDKLFGKEKLKLLGRKSMEEICNNIFEELSPIYYGRDMTISASEDNQVTGILEYEHQ